jgi:hypothetical protein
VKNLARLIVEYEKIYQESNEVIECAEACEKAINNLKMNELYEHPLYMMMYYDHSYSLEWANNILSGEQGEKMSGKESVFIAKSSDKYREWSPCIVFIKRDDGSYDGSYIEWVEKDIIKKIPEYLSRAVQQWRKREQDDNERIEL